MLLLRGFLFALVVVALVAVILSLLRRTPRSRAGADAPVLQPVLAKPELSAPAAPTPALERAEISARLHELALGAALTPGARGEHAKVVAGIGPVLETVATEPRYAPRRPLLLPKLLSAAGDSDTSRRELAEMIARDPALVGSLLKLANSPAYRRSAQPIESVERAVTVLGTQGIRSLAAAALVQPVFRMGGGGGGGQFAEITWEHSQRAAAAAEVHALAVENADPFTAQLLALVTGLGAIVVFRVLADEYARRAPLVPDPAAVAAALDQYTAPVTHRIAESWELSERVLEALEQQQPGKGARPASELGRSLRFAMTAGALSVLRAHGVIDDATGLASIVAAGGIGPKFERLWERLNAPPESDGAKR